MKKKLFLVAVFAHLNLALCNDASNSECVSNTESDLLRDDKTCLKSKNVLDCVPYNPNGATVVYRDSNGRLGNWMSAYEFLVAVEIRFGVKSYLSSKLKDGLERYFAGVEIESGTERLCGMQEVMDKFK